jgi:glutamate--cysteine ligase
MMERCPALTSEQVNEQIRAAFQPVTTPQNPANPRIGIEIEWLVLDAADPLRRVHVDEVRTAVGEQALPAEGVISFEAGGQVELSTQAVLGPDLLIDRMRQDTHELSRRIRESGLRLLSLGLDPVRPPEMSEEVPRLRAIAHSLDRHGPNGRLIMSSTASLQINIDYGADPWRSFQVLSQLGPLISAMFSNSPIILGKITGEVGRRQPIWFKIDPTRCNDVLLNDPEDWLDFALNAEVLMRTDGNGIHAVLDGSTLADWLRSGHLSGYPTAVDVALHLSTLYPPVRPRGWLELRMIDAIADPAREVAIGLVWAMLADVETTERFGAHADRYKLSWEQARTGLADPQVQLAAQEALTLAADRLALDGSSLATALTAWRDGPVAEGRTPGDEALERFNPSRADLGLGSPPGFE